MVASQVALVVGFLLGVLLVIWCVEVFIEAVTRSAVSLGISGFFLAVVLAGVDVENAILGVVAASVELPDLALGTVFGEMLFVLAVAVGLAGVVVPFRLEVPRIYLAMLVLVPIPVFVLAADGTLGWYDGVILTALFVPLLGTIYWHERRSETKYVLSDEVDERIDLEEELEDSERMPAATGDELTGGRTGDEPTADGTGDGPSSDERDNDDDWDLDLDEFVPSLEGKSGRLQLAVAVLAIVGMTIGSVITVITAEGLFVGFGISGLAFGATVLSFIASIEELALTVEPARQGKPHIAVGNVVGSSVFYMTANVGLIAMLHPIDTGGAVMTIHWPFLIACLLVVAAMLARGRVMRFGGVILLGLYVAYWIANYV